MEALPKTEEALPQLNNQKDTVLTAFSKFLAQHGNDILRLRDEVQTATQTQYQEATALSNEKEQELISLRKEMSNKEKAKQQEIEVMLRELEHQREILEKEKADSGWRARENGYEETLKKQIDEISRKDNLISRLNHQIKEGQATCSRLTDSNELWLARKQIAENKRVIGDLEEQVKVTKEAYTDLVTNITNYQSIITSMESKRKRSEIELDALKTQLEQLDFLKKDVSKCQDEITNLKADLVIARAEKTDLATRLSETVAKLQSAQNKCNGAMHRKSLEAAVMRNTIKNLENDSHQLQRALASRFKFSGEEKSMNTSASQSPVLPSSPLPMEKQLSIPAQHVTTNSPPSNRSGLVLRPNATPFRPSEASANLDNNDDKQGNGYGW
ncbi:hypothetical protein ABW20_dc0109865 [Dactylellina cionopaga]|nr:hypothetical protein ABW20_dc0109865 [Dactylellina cionopaga]